MSMPDQHVLGRFRYVPQGHTPNPSPYNYHLPAISEFGDIRILPLRSMRPIPTIDELPTTRNHAQLSTHGFTAVNHPTTLHSPPYGLSSWKDPNLLTKHYIPDTTALLKRITGCKTVITEALLLRSAIWTESDALATHAGHRAEDTPPTGHSLADHQYLETAFPSFIGFNPTAGGVSPAPKPHLDYSPSGARTHIREYHPDLTTVARDIISIEDGLFFQSSSPLKDTYSSTPSAPRWAMYSIWRPLKPVSRDPLALLDQRSMSEEDYIAVNIRTPSLGRDGREGRDTHMAQGYLARYNEGHEWYWIDGQTPEEVLVIGLFDSEMEGRGFKGAGGTLHSSVEIVGGEEGEEARESLEVRCLCICVFGRGFHPLTHKDT